MSIVGIGLLILCLLGRQKTFDIIERFAEAREGLNGRAGLACPGNAEKSSFSIAVKKR